MTRVIGWPLVGLVAFAGVLAGISSAAGIFLRGDLATRTFTTVRGDVVETLTGGIYRFNGESIAAEGVGWDLVTLVAVVPALFLALPGVRRASTRAILFAIGVLAYFLYQYAEYAMTLAYGPLFLVYVVTFATSLSAIALLVSELDLVELAARTDGTFPRRGVTGFGVFMAVLLAGMWLPLIAATAGADQVPQLNGGTTLVVQAFDLGFLVPLGIFTAVTVWRRLAVGYVLAAIVVVKGAAMGAAIAAMLIVEALVTSVVQIVPIMLFASVCAVSLALAWRVFGSIGALPHLAGSPTSGSMAHRGAAG